MIEALVTIGSQGRFTGKERDAETGLDYFGARYMSSAQGRWTSPDLVNLNDLEVWLRMSPANAAEAPGAGVNERVRIQVQRCGDVSCGGNHRAHGGAADSKRDPHYDFWSRLRHLLSGAELGGWTGS